MYKLLRILVVVVMWLTLSGFAIYGPTLEPSPLRVELPEEKPSYSDEDLRILATVVYFEAGGCPDRHQQLVAQVVLNRVADERFPDTVKEVVEAPRQYDPRYTEVHRDVDLRCYENAIEALEGRVECPPDVVYQANFEQGVGIYEISEVDTGWWHSITYFCTG